MVAYERWSQREVRLYKGPMIWNTLPDVLKNIKSLQMFKKELKTFVLNQNIDY